MSTQCLQTAGNNVKLFTCVFDADDLGAELEAPPPWACRIHKEVHRLGAPRETAQARERAREGVARCGRRRVAALIPFCAGLVRLTFSKQKGWKMV